jgi:hypothetical protein
MGDFIRGLSIWPGPAASARADHRMKSPIANPQSKINLQSAINESAILYI